MKYRTDPQVFIIHILYSPSDHVIALTMFIFVFHWHVYLSLILKFVTIAREVLNVKCLYSVLYGIMIEALLVHFCVDIKSFMFKQCDITFLGAVSIFLHKD